MYDQFSQWLGEIRKTATIVAHHKLKDQAGARLSVRGGQVVEGPFMEAKEAVGGVICIETGSLEDAIAIARRCPILRLQNGNVEVRVVEEVRRPGH